MTQEIEDGFTASALVDLTPFTVDFALTEDVAVPTRNGGVWKKKKIIVSSTLYPKNRFAVEITANEYQTLRLLRGRDINRYAATFVKKDTDKFGKLVFSGAEA